MSKIITADQAKVSTVSVDIQVVRIGNRQMTLAVFNQLVREPLIDWNTVQLRGIPWGWINYHKDCMSGDHLHVIWQDGNRLLRDYVRCDSVGRIPQWAKNYRRTERILADAAAACLLQYGTENEPECWPGLLKKLQEEHYFSCRLEEILFIILFTSDEEQFAALRKIRLFLRQKDKNLLDEAEAILRDRYEGVFSFEELWKMAQAAAGEAKKIWDKWDNLYSSLKSLPQLFIAV